MFIVYATLYFYLEYARCVSRCRERPFPHATRLNLNNIFPSAARPHTRTIKGLYSRFIIPTRREIPSSAAADDDEDDWRPTTALCRRHFAPPADVAAVLAARVVCALFLSSVFFTRTHRTAVRLDSYAYSSRLENVCACLCVCVSVYR